MKKHRLFKSHYKITSQQLLVNLSIAAGIIIGLIAVIVTLQTTNPPLTRVGQTATNASAALTVQSATNVAARELFSGKVVDGEKGIVVRLKIKNNTTNVQPFIPVNQVFLKSAEGKLYQMKPIAGIKDPIMAGSIPANATITGDISFMVDDSAKDLWLYFDNRWDNSQPLISTLQ